MLCRIDQANVDIEFESRVEKTHDPLDWYPPSTHRLPLESTMYRLPQTLPKGRTLPRLCSHRNTRPLSSLGFLYNSNQHSQPSSTDSTTSKAAHDSLPGWGGRHARDHAVKRPAHDVQAETSQQGMKDHEEMKEGSDAISRRDERDSNKKAKEEHPEAPEPVIGMNDERGSVCHISSTVLL
ncbi:hypothetical protein FOPE_03207 [Fonsecaea pedrosoi]|nr:hypothetical protein FOPE_03207 [Fonsecaea pedrosoi]